MRKQEVRNKAILITFCTFLVLIAAFSVINLFTAKTTYGNIEQVWDGVEVATSFSAGNGTEENPYQITKGSELAYLRQIVNENLLPDLENKYFVLSNDIDLGGHSWTGIGTMIGEEERAFSGHFDGAGYTVKNFKIDQPTIIDNTDYYGLFINVNNAEIKNLNISQASLTTQNTANQTIAGIITAKVEGTTSISNIAVYDTEMDLTNTLGTANNTIGGLIATTSEETTLQNIYNQITITDVNGNSFGNTIGVLNGAAKNIVTQISYTNLVSTYIQEVKETGEKSKLENVYKLENNNNTLTVTSPENTTLEQVLDSLNKEIAEEYIWTVDSINLKIIKKADQPQVQNDIQAPTNFNFGKSAAIPLHDTGIDGETAYINDLESDYNYYLGLNYTESTDRQLPSGNNQNIYNDSNLVKVYIKYSGANISDESEKGYISLEEQQSALVYYKYYPVSNNQVTIELIDNPFADRPNDKAFNGWITDYNGATISFDKDTYTRTVTIPVTYTNGIPDMINITFNASWINASTAEITSNNNSTWSNAFAELKSPEMQSIINRTVIYEGLEDLYIYKDREVSYGSRYPEGAYNSSHRDISGNSCTSYRGCSYYIQSGPNYDPEAEYYRYTGTTFVVTTPQPSGEVTTPMVPIGTSAAGFYRKVTVPRYQSIAGYYNSSGELQTSGSCNVSAGCTYYELVQFYDSNNNPNVITEDSDLYYLATRDTNIIVLRANITRVPGENNKPYTLTGINNGQDYSDRTLDISDEYLYIYADARIEFITLKTDIEKNDTDATSSTSARGVIYGNWQNLKIGRGLKQSTASSWWDTYDAVNANSIMGGNNSGVGSQRSPEKYKLIVESGLYNTAEVVNGGTSRGNCYVGAQAIFGNDYDRITNNNDSMEVYFSAVGSWGSSIYSGNDNQDLAFDTVIKSGKYGSDKSDVSSGYYVGGRGYGTHYAPKRTIVEGGWIYNLNGGPLTANTSDELNETYTYVKGGQVDFVFGGAGTTTTYGNRIIGVTGGTINYAVFGGSNGYLGSNNDGKLSSIGFVYIGGNAVIGNDNYQLSGNENWGVEKGSVFGIGNGKSSSTSIGSSKGSIVIIDKDAIINNNVYGGGNYGSVGTSGTATSTIKILGGTVKGSVYGGGNNNGAGSNNIDAQINIEMTGGKVEGSIYGGSRTKGTVYGSSTVNVLNGTINTDIYGGGEGGYSNRNNPGTYVGENVNVTIGNNNGGPTINGSVYGGSAYGTVNGTGENSSSSQYKTNVTVNNGTVKQSVFGGGKGNTTYTPKVYGDVTVTVNNGNLGAVYGGNDAKGSPSGDDFVYLNGGTIGNAFGGGNQTGQTTTNIYLQGATVTNLYGGSNQSGNVTTNNVFVTSGTSGNVYGGNNLGGKTTTDNVEITGGTITGDVYGGGNLASATTTNLYLGAANINNVYGGGKSADATTTTSQIVGSTIQNFYGGSNVTGNVDQATLTMEDGNVGSIYGGNNAGGQTNTSIITINNGTINSVYGGGNKAENTTSSIQINNGEISYIYGGGNEAGLNDTAINIVEGNIGTLYGGSNKSGNISDTSINVGGNITQGKLDVTTNVDATNLGFLEQWQTGYTSEATIDVTLTNDTQYDITDWETQVNIPNSTYQSTSSGLRITSSDGVYTLSSDNAYNSAIIPANGGTYTVSFTVYSSEQYYNVEATSTVISPQPVTTSTNPSVNSIFGGNNMGGTTDNSKIKVFGGNIGNIYGGGNEAPVNIPNVNVENATVNNIYGGGNMAAINGNTSVTIKDSNITTNIYGGGNYGEVTGSTEVNITSTNISGSAYGGGNGASAIVNQNTTITVDGNTTIGTPTSKAPQQGCLFGGGNAAATGTESANNSLATVNLVGGKIYGNVYGGANTSVVYGKTDTNIGTSAVSKNNLQEETIDIGGTVFGGGEANAEGSENYDFSFISVTGAIDIEINGTNYQNNNHDFLISGSIFGSGNASSSSGTSEIYIKNLGTRDNPSENISIQRANEVILDNVTMELSGTTDRTNEYSDIKYSLNRIDELNIKNNTMLLLQQNANLLKHFKSTVDIDGQEEKAAVIINDETKQVEKNVDNRLYMIANRNLNVTTNEAATEYGEVDGMTFFGMYQKYGNGTFSYGLYDESINYGDAGDAGDIIIGGSYVLGLHKLNHDITVDGFYSNYINDEYTEITTKYIEPTPPDSNYYMWTIGISAINYNFTMTASKYSSLGTYELSMREFSKGDTTFEVIGFNSDGLTPGVGLIDSNNVPKLADTEEDANSVLGLSMKSETSEWTSYGTTKFLSDNGGTFTGDRSYKTDSQQLAPSMMFYLYHAKNISLNQDLGTVVITMQALTPKNEIEYDVQLITITIDLTAKEYDDGNAYDASITYDKKYEMPAATNVNITNQSQFTAYFDLYAQDSFENLYGRNNDNYHALVTDYALPVGTQITMLDYSSQDGMPQYYYYTIDEDEYNRATQQLATDNEITYRLDKFIKMGSTDEENTYDEQAANESYYDDEHNRTIEEFLFIFDFKETTTTGTHLNKYMKFELRNNEDRTVITVLGIRQNYMYFNLYDSSNVVLKQDVAFDNTYIYPDMQRHISYQTSVTYDQTANRESIINTNYESTSMGLNVKLFDSTGNQVSSSLLTGTSIRMDGVEYFADSEGVFRIKLAGKVSNLRKDLYLLTDTSLPAGNYKMVFSLFASSDGLHNSGGMQETTQEVNITVVPGGNAIEVSSQDEYKVVDGNTRLNELKTNEGQFKVKIMNELESPNLRVSIYKRDIDNKETTTYSEVDFNQVFNSALPLANNAGYQAGTPNERFITTTLSSQNTFTWNYADTLTSGTYRVIFKLYDSNQLIDEDQEYIIIKKDTVQ